MSAKRSPLATLPSDVRRALGISPAESGQADDLANPYELGDMGFYQVAYARERLFPRRSELIAWLRPHAADGAFAAN